VSYSFGTLVSVFVFCLIEGEKGHRHPGGCRVCSSHVHPISSLIKRDFVSRLSHRVYTLVIDDLLPTFGIRAAITKHFHREFIHVLDGC